MIPNVQDLDVTNKRVLVRVDFNVPFNSDGSIADDMRIRSALPTIKLLFDKGAAQLILVTHIGRPDGVDKSLSTKPIAIRLAQLLTKEVQFVSDCIDSVLPESAVVLLENVRFYKEEEANDAEFAKKLASYADVFVNDAFATAHRAHASTVGVVSYLKGAVGLLVQKELEAFDLSGAEHPFVVLLGGAKLQTKLPIIQNLVNVVDHILVGGAMMFTFYKAKGYEIGDSLLDQGSLIMAQMLINNDKIVLPTDVVIASSPDDGVQAKVVIDKGMPAGMIGLDIGPESADNFKQILGLAKTIVWNGPMGKVENEPFEKATTQLANFIAGLTETGVRTIIGGGDSIKMVNKLGIASKFTHVSTGGGASMNLLSGKPLPALLALEK